MIAIQFHSGKITYFVNGKYFASIDTNACDFSNGMQFCPPPVGGFFDESPLVMGGMAAHGNTYDLWEGTIHSVKIYDRVL